MPSGHAALNVLPVSFGACFLAHALSRFWGSLPESSIITFVWPLFEAWFGLGLVCAGLAMIFDSPKLYCKTACGRVPCFVWIWLGSWLALYRATWLLKQVFIFYGCGCKRNDRKFDLIAPKLILGRLTWDLPYVADAPQVDMVIDLTCEWSEPWVLKSVGQYIAVPVVDTTRPTLEQTMFAAQAAVDHRRNSEAGSVYIHCANGYGRSAAIAAAVLLLDGTCSSPEESAKMLKLARPVVSLGSTSRGLCERVTAMELLHDLMENRGLLTADSALDLETDSTSDSSDWSEG